MPTEDDEEKTPAQTPEAKKSSGAWVFPFNQPSAICARCEHRRDEHDVDPVTHKATRCMLCNCPAFVAGGTSAPAS